MEQAADDAAIFLTKAWARAKKNASLKRVLYGIKNRGQFQRIGAHEDMLADRTRVARYLQAIEAQVTPEDTVVDLGTGTGILAFMAARRAKKVYAIEHSRMIELAEFVARSNGIGNIAFLRMHSSRFRPPEKVDVILHEQIGDYLIDEDMIANVCDLRDRVLAPGGRIVPARFEAYLEPLSLRRGRAVPRLWEQEIDGVSFAACQRWLDGRPGFAAMRPRHVVREDAAFFLTEPSPAYTIDLATVDRGFVPGTMRLDRTVVRDGVIDGFCQYFRICFDEANFIDTSPFTADTLATRYHWNAALYPTERIALKAGERLSVEWEITNPTDPANWTVRWQTETAGAPIIVAAAQAPVAPAHDGTGTAAPA